MKGLLNLPEVDGLTQQQIIFVIEYLKDYNPVRAAEVAGYRDPSYGHSLLHTEAVARAVALQVRRRLEEAAIDGAWVMQELRDNHYLARHAGDLKASNTSLQLLGKLSTVDAFAADKVVVTDDEKMRERLERGRQRVAEEAKSKERSFV